jgi:uncharacterized protein YbjT (DUF2867 family)
MSGAPVAVTGANGRTGRAVVRALARCGVSVCAFVRDARQAESVRGQGAREVKVGDLARPETLLEAIEGCRAVVHIGPPMHPDEVTLTSNVLDAARAAGIGHVVYWSVMHPLRVEVRHHRLKLESERLVVECGIPYTILQPIRYMQHLEPIWDRVVREGVHAMPFSVQARFSVADLEDLAAAAAIVVSQAAVHLDATYELAGPEALSQSDMAQVLARLLGRPVHAEALPLETLQARSRASGLGEDRIAQMTAMNAHYDAHGFRGNANVLRWLLGREPTRFEAYVGRLAAEKGDRSIFPPPVAEK